MMESTPITIDEACEILKGIAPHVRHTEASVLVGGKEDTMHRFDVTAQPYHDGPPPKQIATLVVLQSSFPLTREEIEAALPGGHERFEASA